MNGYRWAVSALAIGLMGLSFSDANAADPCRGADGKWSFGGLALNSSTADLASLTKDVPNCPPLGVYHCNVTGTDSVKYVIAFNHDKSMHIAQKSRVLLASEPLPFGLAPNDTVRQALAKIRATGMKPYFGMSAQIRGVSLEPYFGKSVSPYVSIVSIAVNCTADAPPEYYLEFLLDPNGHITGLRQKPFIDNSIYTDDVTYHVNLAPDD